MRAKSFKWGKHLFAAALACASCLHIAFAGEAVPTGKLPDDAQPLSYALDLKIDPKADRFSGKVRIKVKLAKPADHLWLHAREIDVAKASVVDAAGQSTDAKLTVRDPSGVAEVDFGKTLPAQDIELVFDYSAPFNAKLQGLYKVKVGQDDYIVTQMEAISARYAFPGFDEPRFKTPFDITLTVPAEDVAIANTRQTAEDFSHDKKWKTLVFAQTKPLPTYLIAVAVGPWDVVEGPALAANNVRAEALPLRGIGPRGSGAQLKWILDQTPAIVKFYEEYTQQPYPFDKLDLLGAPDFAAGAMENAGLIVYRDALLRIDAHSPTRAYLSGFGVNAHEIAHQWFGDLVTVPWWDDIWLNESFATWGASKAEEALHPEYHGDIGRLEGTLGAMRADSLLSARRIRQPIDGQGDIENAFDGITYQKGAALLHMIEEWVGEDAYRQTMRDYLAAHKFGSGDSNDLIATIANAKVRVKIDGQVPAPGAATDRLTDRLIAAIDSGRRKAIAAAMKSFLDQPGLPQIHAELECRNGEGGIVLSQSRYLPYGVLSNADTQWVVPVCARLGHGASSATQCFLLNTPKHEFALDACADWVMPNADAAGYYRFTLAPADFAALKAKVDALSPVEQMAYADALSSAFAQGSVGPGALLDAMPALAGSAVPQVATALLGDFNWIYDNLAGDAQRPALDAYVEKLYAPSLAKLGLSKRPDDDEAATRLRTALVGLLATQKRDAALRAKLVAQGRAALGLNGGKADLDKLDPDLRGTILRATVQDAGEPALRAALAELDRTRQTALRYELLAAIGSTRDAKLAGEMRNLGLTDKVAIGEFSYFYGALANGGGETRAESDARRAAFWQWLQGHYDALRERLPDTYQARVAPLAAGGRCSKAQADELQGFFAERIKAVIGGERVLAQSLERIGQCGALREHIGDKALPNWVETHPAP